MQNLKILVVDDQAEARAMLRDILGEFGITNIFEAPDGREALDFIDTADDFIDMIICDWNMPKMTGVDVLRQLRSVDPSMPFVMVTGRGDYGSVVEAKTTGVTAYIRKPFSHKEIEAKLRIIVQRIEKTAH